VLTHSGYRPRFVPTASALLYGSPVVLPVPDLERTDFALLIGTNPLVSRGSLISAGNLRERFSEIVERGGRVVVIDPRRRRRPGRSNTSASGPTAAPGCCSPCST